jgi:pimeloyl-ACP methyl ester carboxylesterase
LDAVSTVASSSEITELFRHHSFPSQTSSLFTEKHKMNKLRILCLHGFTSNGTIHALQIRSLTDALSKYFDFICPDGPHAVDMSQQGLNSPSTKAYTDYVNANSTSGHRAWWFARDDPTNSDAGSYEGLEQSLDYLGNYIQESGPVHAIWGFSQGACFAGLLTALLSDQLKDHPLRKHLPSNQGSPSAGVFVSGFRARFSQYDSIYAKGIDVPTLSIIGEKDDAVTPERSEALMEVCRNPSVLRHSGGHEIPSSAEHQATIITFLREQVNSKNRESL